MKYIVYSFFIAALIVGAIGGIAAIVRTETVVSPGALKETENALPVPAKEQTKTLEERIRNAEERSSRVKGLYMTAAVATDQGRAAGRLRDTIISLAETTEINGVVIDVKEVCGPEYNSLRLQTLLEELHKKNIWAIARIVTFKDVSHIKTHPGWYLTRTSAHTTEADPCKEKEYLRDKNSSGEEPNIIFWQDKKGGYWLDPADPDAREYIAGFAKKMIDLGFDELQFDYVRFPSDGDVENAIYPAWDRKTRKEEVLKSFFGFINTSLKTYKPEIILSADLFGYVAATGGDSTIGQNLADIGNSFDYVSFMVYPSHYYNGLTLPPEPEQKLEGVAFSFADARTHPDVVVYRSLLYARDFLEGKITLGAKKSEKKKSVGTSSPQVAEKHITPVPLSRVKFRPWLEDFFHEQDRIAKRPYGAQKVRMQIDGAEKSEDHGWLLWNASNVYTKEALKLR